MIAPCRRYHDPMRHVVRSVLCALVVLATACGEDGLAEDDFVDDLAQYSVPEKAARCVYDEIKDDQSVIDDIRENGIEDKLSAKSADRLESVLTGCLKSGTAETDGSTTTTEG